MTALSDGEIAKGCVDPKNWGCGSDTFLVICTAIVAGLIVWLA